MARLLSGTRALEAGESSPLIASRFSETATSDCPSWSCSSRASEARSCSCCSSRRRDSAIALLRRLQAVLRLLKLLEVRHHPVGFVQRPIGREVLLGRYVIGIAADPVTDDHERVHDDDLAKRLGSEPPHIELTEADAGVTFPDAVEVEPRLELGERLQVAVQRPGHFPDNPEAGMAGAAGPSGVMLDLPKHVLRLEPLRERLLEDHQPAFAHLGACVDALRRERIEDVLSAIVDDTDTKLAALEAGADVRDGDRHLLVALVVQRADVVGRTELLYCRANSFEAIVGIHGVLPKALILASVARQLNSRCDRYRSTGQPNQNSAWRVAVK